MSLYDKYISFYDKDTRENNARWRMEHMKVLMYSMLLNLESTNVQWVVGMDLSNVSGITYCF